MSAPGVRVGRATRPVPPPPMDNNLAHQPFPQDSSNNIADLRAFHDKYYSPYTGGPSPDTEMPPSIQGSPAQPNAHRGERRRQKGRDPARAREIRERRKELRELQEWEYQSLIAPRRWANSGPIGLLGFGMATLLTNLTNTGHFQLDTVVPATAICVGGGAQLIAGVLECIRGNTFSACAFCCFGAYWLALTCVWMLPNKDFSPQSTMPAASEYMTGAFLLLYGVFNVFMVACTLRMNVTMFVLLLFTTLLYLWQGGAHMTHNESAIRMSGYEGAVAGGIALYVSFAEVLNESWDCTILPQFPISQVLGWFGADTSVLSPGRSRTNSKLSKEETPGKRKTSLE